MEFPRIAPLYRIDFSPVDLRHRFALIDVHDVNPLTYDAVHIRFFTFFISTLHISFQTFYR